MTEVKEKIPTTFKEHFTGFVNDLKLYKESKKILRKNMMVYICKNCNIIYPLNHNNQCDKCNCKMELFPSRVVTIGIPTRKQKYAEIKRKNEEIDRLNDEKEKMRKLELELATNEKIINEFTELKNNIDSVTSSEILEILTKINELKIFFDEIPKNKRVLTGIYNIDNFIKDKIKTKLEKKLLFICKNRDKEDMLKSFIEEIKYSQTRFPQYKDILEVHIIKAENFLEEEQT